jgi:DNA-directed RNA polymerase specialized sigma24 family protein
MGFLFFGKKRYDINQKFSDLHNSLAESFSKVKEDVISTHEWIGDLNKHKESHKQMLEELDSRLNYIESFIEEIISGQTAVQTHSVSKQTQTDSRSKRTSVSVQTEVLDELRRLTPMERSLVWALLNTDLKLSYADLARVLGKDESTVRGQVSNIRKKTDDLIGERNEVNGQKRFYIDERVKSKILREYKVKNRRKGR